MDFIYKIIFKLVKFVRKRVKHVIKMDVCHAIHLWFYKIKIVLVNNVWVYNIVYKLEINLRVYNVTQIVYSANIHLIIVFNARKINI